MRPDTEEEKWYFKRSGYLSIGWILLLVSAFCWLTVFAETFVQDPERLEELKVKMDKPMNVISKSGKYSHHEIIFSFADYKCSFNIEEAGFACTYVSDLTKAFAEGDSVYIQIDKADAHTLRVLPDYDGQIEIFSISKPGREEDFYDLECRNHRLKKDRIAYSTVFSIGGIVLLVLASFNRHILKVSVIPVLILLAFVILFIFRRLVS